MAEVVISRNTFFMGLVIAILASSLLSTVISSQLSVGPQGVQGPQGSQGVQGLQGIQGVVGSQGEQGIQGEKGDIGDTGDAGPQGIKGELGPPGVFTIENISGWLPAPAYDSGWVPRNGSHIVFEHGLNTTEVIVYVTANNTEEWIGINQMYYGDGDGLWWCHLTNNEIWVYDYPHAEMRVRIWKIAQP